MQTLASLRHTRWHCNYHIVWIPKCRKKKLYGQLRQSLGEVFHELARQKECQIEEGHLQPDHVHILISIPPKYSVAQVVGYINRCRHRQQRIPSSWKIAVDSVGRPFGDP